MARSTRLCATFWAFFAALALPAIAQSPNPADSAKNESGRSDASPPATAPEDNPNERPEKRSHSWELPPVTVTGERLPELREEEPVGTYGQARWTARRRFGETRVYVVPEGQIEFEYWLIPEWPRHSKDGAEVETRYEVEMGLPHRFQLDLYAVTHQGGNKGTLKLDEQKFEVRWALADWGKIFANPTLYLEWKAIDSAPDHVEVKTLFGGQIAPRWHAALNFVFEHEMGGEQENSYEVTTGVSYTVIDEKFSIGAEAKFAFVNTKEDRGDIATEALLGPSLQVRPLPQMHINVSPLFGLNDDSPKAKVVLVFGWEF